MKWLRFGSWSISAHVLLWSLLPVVVSALALAAGWSTYDRVRTTSALTADSRTTLHEVSELLQAVVDLETGVRGYALTADPVFLEPYQSAQPRVTESLAQLRVLVRDRPDQLARVERVNSIVLDWNDVFAQPVIDAVQGGQDVRQLVALGIGKRRIDAIRAEVAAFESAETAVLDRRVADDAAAWRLAALLSVGAVVTLLLSSILAALIGRRVVGSVRAFARAADEIANGYLETRLPEDGRNELAVTGRAINRMAGALSDAREELLAQNDMLVEQVREADRARGQAREILDATSDAIVLVGPDRTYRTINRRFSDLFGIEPDMLIGRQFSDTIDLLHQIFEDAETLRERLTDTSLDDRSELSERVKQKWPACRDLDLMSSPVHSESGEYLGRLYVLRDVTYEARLDEQRRELEAERARAAEVQADLLPHAPPMVSGVQLAGRCIPALQVGGDFFDWYAADGLIWLTLGDVMGKGMAAALLMATVRATLRAGIHERSPAAALDLAQAVLGEDLGHRDSYVTLLHAVYEPSSGRLEYVDAGHGHALIRRADGSIERLERRSFPLGMPFAIGFEEGQVTLRPGDALIMYSDGLIDAGPNIDMTSIARRLDGAETAQQMVDRLIQLAAGSSTPSSMSLVDDLTVVALTAVEAAVAAARPDDEQDSRFLIATGGGRIGAW